MKVDSVFEWVFGFGLVLLVLMLAIAFGLLVKVLTADTLELDKAEWSCSDHEIVTIYRTVVMGNSSTVVPSAQSVCVEYRRNAQ